MSLTNLNQRTKTSDRLFYNQYKYCFKLYAPHASALTSLDHEHVNSILDMRQTLWNKSRRINFGGSWASVDEQITNETRNKFHNAVNYFKQVVEETKLVVLQSFMYVYTNRYNVRDELLNLGFPINQITTVKVNRPLGSVKSLDEESKTRCYFKQVEITNKEHELLKSFIKTNIEGVKPSLGLEYFFGRSDRLLRNYFFLDFTEDSLITTLELMTPNLVRKVSPIVK
mgnify:CR=1 FL=1